MYNAYKDRVAVYIVYIREAHPTDGWQVRANERDGVLYEEPTDTAERKKVASDCAKAMKLTIPMLIDDEENTAQRAYAAWPDRFYIIGRDGKVAYRGEPGPRGFKPPAAEAALEKALKD
jgi:hypothetical protein